ncbi:MAG TPA: hypothetical protein VG345_09990, partial [Bryobacteraceae bacterium]|nr:hypothetical protein [Bryobacteraceae bacterium]
MILAVVTTSCRNPREIAEEPQFARQELLKFSPALRCARQGRRNVIGAIVLLRCRAPKGRREKPPFQEWNCRLFMRRLLEASEPRQVIERYPDFTGGENPIPDLAARLIRLVNPRAV